MAKKVSEKQTSATEEIRDGISIREIEIPIDTQTPDAKHRLHIDLRLSPLEANAIRRITSALDKRGESLVASGRRVVNPHHTIRWLIEKVAAAAEIGDVKTNGEF